MKALINRLKQANEWRRGADMEMPDPKQLGMDIDMAIDLLRWRDVNEELPEDSNFVLCKTGSLTNPYKICAFDKECNRWYYAEGETILFWRPINL